MQSISIFSKIIRFFVAFVVAVCLSCFELHADDCVLGTDGCAPEFTVTTTELSAETEFSFTISAAGTYYIDWGDGGAIETIVKEAPNEETITHTYANAGQYTIGMAGQATLYSTDNTTAAISFSGNTNISGISGSLGAIFGTLTDRVNSDGTLMADAQPSFYQTFRDCSGLTGSIPENLFAGISGAPADYMFYATFYGCSGLSGSIPENLFAGISGAPADYMFYTTFNGCSNLSGSIPENLFAGISGTPASNMFYHTFSGCSNLSGSIPENLFAGISGAPASYMFFYTFSGCSNLSGSIPENLFAGISGAPAGHMFSGTFNGCSNLSGSIPENLFAGISGTPAVYMFSATFYGCSGLSGSIPENLFAGIKGTPASYMFSSTFYGCSNLSGSIPENLFAGIKGAPAAYMFNQTFSGCSNLSGSIPENLFAGLDGAPASSMFESTFRGCSGLTGSIPENLFAGINGVIESGDTYMFAKTFYGCSGLTGSIPENLFAGISGAPASYMFSQTFYGCSNLSGYVPKNLFAGIDKTTTATAQMGSVFTNSGLAISCPASTYEYITGFESYFGGKVSCSICPSDFPNSYAGATTENQCYKQCTTDDVANSMSVVGNIYYGSDTNTCSATECVDGIKPTTVQTLSDVVGRRAGTDVAYVSYTGKYNGGTAQSVTGLKVPNSFIIRYFDDFAVSGYALCSTKAGTATGGVDGGPTTYDNLVDESADGAQNCYCGVGQSLDPGDGSVWHTFPITWVWRIRSSLCEATCLMQCRTYLKGTSESYLAYRASVFKNARLANATCEEVVYTLNPGEYLVAGTTEPVKCPSGYYCPGAGDVKYDEEKDQGLVACPVDYPNSDTGATSENECYKPCTTDDVANSMSVTGKNYYGTGADTCAATECVAGWVIKDFVNIINSNSASAVNSANITNDGVFQNGGGFGREYYGISEPNTFAIDYGEDGMITGHGRCSTKVGNGISSNWDVPTQYDELDDETGQSGANYCYCRVDSYTSVGGLTQILSDEPWTFVYTLSNCAQKCSLLCKDYINGKTGGYYKHILGNATCVVPEYAVKSGKYLPAGGEEPADCPSGYYCPGAGDVKLNDEKDQGLVACPVDYLNSDTGATSENQCYKQCTTDDVAGAMTVVGTDYYGDGLNTCDATECVAGWRLKSGKTLVDVIGTEPGINSASVNSAGSFLEANHDNLGAKGRSYYGINDNMSFAVDYGERGMVTGKSLCSSRGGVGSNNGVSSADQITRFDELDDETSGGTQYCYCKLDNYTPYGGVKQSVSTPWFLYGYLSNCGAECSVYCASNLMHLSSSSFLAQALFDSIKASGDMCEEVVYTLNPGKYLPAGGEEPADCPSGYYCPGAGDVKYDEEKDQGLVVCPVDYPNSDTGAKTENDCYKQCTTDDVANSMSVTGKNYYGDGADTCAATQCLADWRLQDLYGVIGDAEGLNSAYISTNSTSYGEFVEYDNPQGQDYYGISEPWTFGVGYGDAGIITGRARCSTKPGVGGANPTVFKELDDESGVDGAQYCYCQVDSYTPVGGLTQVLSDKPWVFYGNMSSGAGCVSGCVAGCTGRLKWIDSSTLAFRIVAFGYASCDEEVYRVKPGDYLPAGADAPSDCPPGSYCPGAEDISSRPSKAQGANECPSEYPYSDAGATTESQCFRDCTGDDVANAMTVVGRNYYGDGVDTCAATDCVSGWHVKHGVDLEELIGSTYDGSNSSYMAGTNSAYINNAGEFVEYDIYGESHAKDYYGISENNSFAVGYGEKGMITGRARCSSQSENSVENLPDESGNSDAYNCYCTIDSYTPVDGTKQTVSAPWIKYGSINWYPGACDSYCVQNCSVQMREHMYLDFRGKMFDASYELPVCLGNKINVEWNPANGEKSSTTTCSYNDVIEYPTDPVRPGYTFTGWKVVDK